jgi:hypothetical protein
VGGSAARTSRHTYSGRRPQPPTTVGNVNTAFADMMASPSRCSRVSRSTLLGRDTGVTLLESDVAQAKPVPALHGHGDRGGILFDAHHGSVGPDHLSDLERNVVDRGSITEGAGRHLAGLGGARSCHRNLHGQKQNALDDAVLPFAS